MINSNSIVNKKRKLEGNKILQLKEENEKLESQLNSMFNIVTLINELTLSVDLDEIYRNILDILVVSIGSRRHSIGIIDEVGILKIVSAKFGDDEIDFEHVISKKGIIKKVIDSKKYFIENDFASKKNDDILACIPLLVREKVIGVIIINELLSHKKEFTEDDGELFNLISQHAGISIEAAKSYNKSQKDLEKKDKEITKLFDISSLVSYAKDLLEVFNVVQNAIVDLLSCDIINILLYDEEDEKLILKSSMGLDPALQNKFTLDLGKGISGRVLKWKKPILIKNTNNEVRYKELLNTEEGKFYSGSILSVPLMVKSKSIGVITVSKVEGNFFLDTPEKKILTTLAAQVAFEIERVHIQENKEKEFINISNLFIATNQLHSTLDLDDIYKISSELLLDFIGAKIFSILLKDPSGKELSILISNGIEEEVIKKTRIPVGEGIIGKAVEEDVPFILSDGQEPPCVKLYNKDFNLFACIPLKLEDKVVGAIVINELLFQKKSFVKFDRELFNLMAEHTATAIVRAQLFAKAEQKTTSSYDILRLLTLNSNLIKSLEMILDLINHDESGLKSLVLLYDNDSASPSILTSRGYTIKELNTIKLDVDSINIMSVPLYCGKENVGEIRVEKKSGVFDHADSKLIYSSANLISQAIENDNNFKISKSLAVLLDKEKRQSKAIVKGVADGLMVTDLKNNILMINPMVEQLFNIEENIVVGADIGKYINNKQIKNILNQTSETGYGEKKINIEAKDSFKTINIKSSIILDDKKKPIGVVSIFHDITKEIESEKMKDDFLKKLKKLSITDPLTQIYNRGYIDGQIKKEFNRCKRYGRTISFIILDIDHFKSVNDTFGHDIGDDVLKHVTKIITGGVRNVDMFGRYGGEEFVVLLPETNSENAYIVAERLRISVEKALFVPKGNEINITVSLGISTFPSESIDTFEDLIKHADVALYKAKGNGRNRTEVSSLG